MPRKKFNVLAQYLQDIMEESLPKMVDDQVKELTKTQVLVYVVEGFIMEREKNQTHVAKMIADAIPQERKNLQAEITLQLRTSCYRERGCVGHRSRSPLSWSASTDWTEQDDQILSLSTSALGAQHLLITEICSIAKRQKTTQHGTYVFGESSYGQVNESEPGPLTSDAKLLEDIVWESKKEILVSPYPQMPTPVVQSCQRDPKVPALSLVNQDLLYLKKGNSRPEMIVLSLHKFPANPHAKIFYIKRQKEQEKPKEVYSNLKIVQVIKTYGEIVHEHKFIMEIIARRANGSIVSITEPDYKNLNKNDIADMYLLCINGKVGDYYETGLLWSLSVFIRSTMIWERVHDFQLGVESHQQKVNLTALTITFLGIEKYKMFSIHFQEKHVTWARLGKKLDKNVMEMASRFHLMPSGLKRDGITTLCGAFTMADKEKPMEHSTS
ncbi:hypothetical protein Tco_0098974 [Tanacetum coccineum]